ncbi:MFS transporter [Mycobacterium syngnathidarum]|uniref:MFS transporter n=2 Tax=Mycobacterium syngnathidarum TaxID=1908205 RepID=A0A1S1JWM2_9MYCO|nr:MFS transporter [Mycobacterium syngnathidarum]OHT97218.1 MFS transporter [Mycobacterium syngnathidarum]
MIHARASRALWHSLRSMTEFRRLLELRAVSQFGDGLFQAGLAGAILFNPERQAEPWQIAAAFAVMFLPYSVLGPFAGALLDRWDRRLVLIGANLGRLIVVLLVGTLLAFGAGDIPILCCALIVNGLTRFVSSGLSASLPDVVPHDRVVTMNSVATAVGALAAFLGADFMLVPRKLVGADDTGASVVMFIVALPVALALWLSVRFGPHVLGPHESKRAIHGSVVYAVATGWVHGIRTVWAVRPVAGTLAGLAAHRMAFGINSLLVLVIVRHTDDPDVTGLGLGTAVLFVAAGGVGQFLATIFAPAVIGRFGRYATANGALGFAVLTQLVAIGLHVPVMLACGFLLGAAGQLVKLCADSAMQLDVDDALRGHVFTVQDALFWMSFVAAIAVAAAVIPADGRSPALVVAGAAAYLVGLGLHATVVSRKRA